MYTVPTFRNGSIGFVRSRMVSWRWREDGLRLLVPVVAGFLCFVFVVVRPLSRLGGK